QQLAGSVGVRFQQIQKYEAGANRISASRLWDIATALGVPVSFFFEGLAGERPDPAAPVDLLADRAALDLVRAYYALPEAQRRRLFALARALGAAARPAAVPPGESAAFTER